LIDRAAGSNAWIANCPMCLRWCGYVRAEVEGRFNRYTLIDDRIREIVRLGESIVIDNADRLTSCLVLATEQPS
jgi:hypothetical protein